MKITDDYRGKVRLWVRMQAVVSAPPPPALPKFSAQKFSSHRQMNEWKRSLLERLAREGPDGG